MMTRNGGCEGGKNGGRRDCIEGREVGGVGGRKNNGMNQLSLLYVNV